jgi:PAS domain-containing protein
VEERIRLTIKSIRALLDAAPLASVIRSADMSVLAFNAAAERLFQFTSKAEFDHFYDNIFGLQPDGVETRQLLREMHEAACATGSRTFEWVYLTKDGKPLHLETTYVHVHPEKNSRLEKAPYLAAYTRDLTALKANEQLVRQAEEYNQIMLDGCPLACNLFSDDCRVLDCNTSALRMHGVQSKREYLDSFFTRLSPQFQPDGQSSREKVLKMIKRAFASGREVFEWTHTRMDGSPIPAEVTLVRLQWRNSHRLAGYVRDLTASNVNERHVRQAEKYNQMMLDGCPLACNLFSDDCRVLDCNASALRLHAVQNKREYLDSFFTRLSPQFQPDGENSHEKALMLLKKALASGREVFEWTYTRMDGCSIPTEVTLVRLQWRNGYRIAAYVRDLTAVKANEQYVRQTEEYNHLMLEGCPLACNLISDDCRVLDCNASALRMYGVQSKREYLDSFFTRLSPLFQPDGQSSHEKALKMMKKAFASGREVFEWTHTRMDGSSIPAEVTLVRLKWRNSYRLAGYVRDLTDEIFGGVQTALFR